MKNIEWEDVWNMLLLTLCIFILTVIGFCIFKDSKVERYDLSSSNLDNLGRVYVIEKKVIWGCNTNIYLPNVTLSEAIRAIDSLNKTIK